MASAESAVRREAARLRGEPMVSIAGEPGSPYSIGRAIALAADRTAPLGSFEAEVSQELSRGNDGIRPDSVKVPPQLFTPSGIQASLSVGGALSGQELAFRRLGATAPGLHPTAGVSRLGATIISSPDALRFIQITPPAIEWTTEELTAPVDQDTDAGTSAENPAVSTALCTIPISRELLMQASPDVAQIAEGELRRAADAIIDQGAVAGEGTGGEPAGLLQRATDGDLPTLSIDGLPSYAALCDMEAVVGANNADSLRPGWLCSSAMRALLRRTAVLGTGGTTPTWAGGMILDAPAVASNHVPDDLEGASPILYSADWSQLVVVIHSVELIADKYARKREGVLELTIFVACSIAVLQPLAFCVSLDTILEAT